jgi:hypothetical protein
MPAKGEHPLPSLPPHHSHHPITPSPPRPTLAV